MAFAPKGYRIRLMEPGEAETLLALGTEAGLFGPERPDLSEFVRWLLRHEVFVAERAAGGVSGFAAARDATDLYWLSALAVDPAAAGEGVRKGLLAAVLARAGWFFHRAVGLSLPVGDFARQNWFRRRRFLDVPRSDWTSALIELAEDHPVRISSRHEAEGAAHLAGTARSGNKVSETVSLVGTERCLMLHWL